jgi:CheY-like chemotaxis protein
MDAPGTAPTRVLVVDDERNITELVCMALRYEGFQVESAATARQAREAVLDHHPDLIVLDIGLPDEDGFSLTQRLVAEGHRVPVIFLTARDATEEKVRGLTVGGDDYVTKPFSIDELVARIRAVLRRYQGSPASTSSRLTIADLELDPDRVPAAPVPARQRPAGALPRSDPRPCLGLRLRRRRRGPGDLHQLPPAQGGLRRSSADPHRARGGLRAPASPPGVR